jgi:hypothetical protein
VGPRAAQDDVEERKFLNLPGLELRTLGCPARSLLSKSAGFNFQLKTQSLANINYVYL